MVRGAPVPMEVAARTSQKNLSMLKKNMQVLQQYVFPSRQGPFQGRACIIQQDNAGPHTVSTATA